MKTPHKILALLAVASSMAIAGCQSDRFSNEPAARPQPLPAAPAGSVQGNALPPPSMPAPTNPQQFPQAPGQQQASLGTPDQTPMADPNAPDLTPASVAGVWSANLAGQSCRIATPQTRFGSGYRAGPLRCPAPVDGVKSWSVSGKQLTLHDANGGTLANLSATGNGRFDGQTQTGVPISLSR
ncbi:protease inhibitor Inh/omp19 family protein [Limoniibacter endophyticus]|uniref:Outer membrane lipoprotein omp19 n=1 Tax=Limoniibacter endophyticus TaxID=1565040 RepID=A0A8J3DI80_9HYPH|nr:protease inhibitor Inh/omp19 family protein [Limoniibacter endophyticus]GHC74213.1 outer membrane lipoprotein omp19 [Limoniibacter endophyticus]